MLVQEVACIWTAARRSVTDSFVHHVINVGRNKALLTCTQDRRKKKKKVKKDKPAPPPQDNAYLQFFLTEFDNMGPTGGGGSDDDASSYYYVDGDSDDENDSLNSPNKRKKGPMGPSPNIRQASRYAQGTTASTRTQGQSSKKKQYDPNDYKVKQLIKKHTEVMKTMEDEQTKRAALVEQVIKSHNSHYLLFLFINFVWYVVVI